MKPKVFCPDGKTWQFGKYRSAVKVISDVESVSIVNKQTIDNYHFYEQLLPKYQIETPKINHKELEIMIFKLFVLLSIMICLVIVLILIKKQGRQQLTAVTSVV